MTQVVWDKLRNLIASHIGFKIRHQDTQYTKEKIESRVKQLKLSNLQEYYDLLYRSINSSNYLAQKEQYRGQKEWKILASLITNGESFFFRDRGQFDLLKNTIIPQIINKKIVAKKRGELSFLTLKIWSAGCSTGEEVYSLAMLVSELIPNPVDWNIVIIGTDINQDFLAKAGKGIYSNWSFRLTEPHFKEKYFLSVKNRWQVRPHLKTMVNFYQDNLIDEKFIAHHNYNIDLVVCRNVFIYFDPTSIQKAINKISSVLSIDGYFLSGHTELQSVATSNFSILTFPESIIYQYLGAINTAQQSTNILSTVKNFNFTDRQIQTPTPFNSKQAREIEQNWHWQKINYSDSPEDIENKQSLSFSTNKISPKIVADVELNNDTISNKLQEIQTLLEKGIYDRVVSIAEKLIVAKPNCQEAHYLIARAHANKGDFEAAKKHCADAKAIAPLYIDPLVLLAQIAEEENHISKAKELLKRVIYIEPLFITAYLNLGDIYLNEGDFKRSQKMYQVAYELLQESPQEIKAQNKEKIEINKLLAHVKSQLSS